MEKLLIIPFMFSIMFATYFTLRFVNYLKARMFRKSVITFIEVSDKKYFLKEVFGFTL